MSRADLIRFVRSLRSATADRVILYSVGDAHLQSDPMEGSHIESVSDYQASRPFFTTD